MYINVFDNPMYYINEITSKVRINRKFAKEFTGKSIASIFPTKFCDAGCPHCFFRSDKDQFCVPQEQFEISDYGLEKFIEFINLSNNGYLLVIGGGEPFKKFDYVKEIIKRVKTDKLVLVTSGIWAKSYTEAKKIIFELYDCYKMRNDNTKVILRLSVDTWHSNQLGKELIHNVIDTFKEFFKEEENFELALHSLVNDNIIYDIIEERNDCKIEKSSHVLTKNEQVIKLSPNVSKIIFDNGLCVTASFSRRFYSNLKQNLNINSPFIKNAVKIFNQDVKYSAFDNHSIIPNKDGKVGLNFWINYNGNVCLWVNQQLYDLSNIYVDSYDDFINSVYNNIVSYSFLDKGYSYRSKIISEVNPRAVLRAAAINIRDFAGASILEEYNTVLYYAIRVIQDYIKDKIINISDLSNLPIELVNIINYKKKDLISEYKKSSYSIFKQYMDKDDFIEDEWKDLFNLVYMGHYDVSKEQIYSAIEFYNLHASRRIHDIEDVLDNSKQQYQRLIERLTFMKPEAKEFCLKQYENKVN